MDDKFREYIWNQCKQSMKDSTLIDYNLVFGDDQIIKLEQFDYDIDCRLLIPEYKESSFTVVMYEKKTNEYICKGTFFILDYQIWKDIDMWNEKDNLLTKVYLNDYIKEKEKKCIIAGYLQNSNLIRSSSKIGIKSSAMKIYYSLIKILLNMEGCFYYCEPCGYFMLSNNVAERSQLSIVGFDKSKIGQVDPVSAVSEKMAKDVHMTRLDKCYHKSTLGPIYIINK